MIRKRLWSSVSFDDNPRNLSPIGVSVPLGACLMVTFMKRSTGNNPHSLTSSSACVFDDTRMYGLPSKSKDGRILSSKDTIVSSGAELEIELC